MITIKDLANHTFESNRFVEVFLRCDTVTNTVEFKYFGFLVSRIEVKSNYLRTKYFQLATGACWWIFLTLRFIRKKWSDSHYYPDFTINTLVFVTVFIQVCWQVYQGRLSLKYGRLCINRRP